MLYNVIEIQPWRRQLPSSGCDSPVSRGEQLTYRDLGTPTQLSNVSTHATKRKKPQESIYIVSVNVITNTEVGVKFLG